MKPLRSLLFLVAALPTLTLSQGIPKLARCFGKDFSAYEAILGTKSERGQDVSQQYRIYRRGRNGNVTLGKDNGALNVTVILVMFPCRLNWRDALRQLGLSSVHCHLVYEHGYFLIEGCRDLPKGWMVWWQPNVPDTKQSEISLGVPHPMVK